MLDFTIIAGENIFYRQKNFESAIVIQGPFKEHDTHNTITMMTERNPQSLIILSTYETPLLSSEKCENIVLILNKIPSKEKYPDFWLTNFYNQNLQRLTSFVGVQHAKNLGIPVCLKVRSDGIFGKQNICEYLDFCSKSQPLLGTNTSQVKRRLVVSDKSRKYFPGDQVIGEFFVYDHWLFGETEDLFKFYDMTEGSAWHEGRGIETSTTPETHLTKCWMKNVGINDANNLVELASKYLVVTSTLDVEFVWQKGENLQRYLCEGKSYLQHEFSLQDRIRKYYTRDQWLKTVLF